MRKAMAVALGALLPLLGLSGIGEAQAPQSIRVAGTIAGVDCHGLTVAIDTGGGARVYRAAGAATFYANGAGIALCDLQRYAGAPASVWLTALGNELLVTRVDVGGQVGTPAAPAPAPYTSPAPPPSYGYPAPAYPSPYPYYGYPGWAAPPVVGAVLGTIVVGGLLYLLVHGPYGYYRYPYYGPYYRYYYRPYYGPYRGPYFYTPLYRYPAYRWCGGRGYGYWCR